MDHKRFFLERVIKENPNSKILAFVRTKVRAERVRKAMERASISALTIHGDKDQEERSEVMRQFKSGEINLLIATDVTARGIDIPDVAWIFQFDPPQDSDQFIHRIGRTARAGNSGNSLILLTEKEKEYVDFLKGRSVELKEMQFKAEGPEKFRD